MNNLKSLIRLLINEILDEDILKNSNREVDPDIKEFSGVGAIAGFTAPLGYSAQHLHNRKKQKKKSKK